MMRLPYILGLRSLHLACTESATNCSMVPGKDVRLRSCRRWCGGRRFLTLPVARRARSSRHGGKQANKDSRAGPREWERVYNTLY
jgi:hypothetical protein